MDNNKFSNDICLSTNDIGINISDPDSCAQGTLYASLANNTVIGYENMIIDRKCTIRSGDDIVFEDTNGRTFGRVSGTTGSAYMYYPSTDGAFGFNLCVGSSTKSVLTIPTTAESGRMQLNLGNSSLGNTKISAGSMVRFTKGIQTSSLYTGLYSTDGTTNSRYMHFNSNNNLIVGGNDLESTSIYLFSRYNSQIVFNTNGGVDALYVGKTGLCQNNINVTSKVTFKLNGGNTTITPTTVSVSRNTTNTQSVSGYVYYYPVLNIVQVNLAFTLNAVSASTIYTLGTISSTYAPVTTAGMACHVNGSADHSTGIINSSGTISVYMHKAQTSGKTCYMSGVYSID